MSFTEEGPWRILNVRPYPEWRVALLAARYQQYVAVGLGPVAELRKIAARRAE